MLIDTHCHLNFPEQFPDPAGEVAFALSQGVSRMVAVGCDLPSSQAAVALAHRFQEIYAVVGVHPNYSAGYKNDLLDAFREMLAHPKSVALGEIGLDYHWDYATREQQYEALSDQLTLAQDLNCPVVFHCREAYGDLLDILEQRATGRGAPWVLHCFAGSSEDAQRAVAMDCYFGVDGPLTYKNAQALRDIVQTLPRDRIVIETDSPYLTPVPHRGKPNRPGYVTFVNNMLASLWGISIEEAAQQTTENAKRLFPRLT